MHRRKTHHTFWLSLTFLHVQYYFFSKKDLYLHFGTEYYWVRYLYRVVRYKKKLPKFYLKLIFATIFHERKEYIILFLIFFSYQICRYLSIVGVPPRISPAGRHVNWAKIQLFPAIIFTRHLLCTRKQCRTGKRRRQGEESKY